MKTRGSIGCATLVYQEWKRDAGLFTKQTSVVAIPQTDGCQVRARFFELGLMVTQLRDVLTAEDSTEMAEKD